MNKGSQRRGGKARNDSDRTDPTAPEGWASDPQRPTGEPAIGQGQQKAKAATTARKRRAPFVL
jgi:hypothetical protein